MFSLKFVDLAWLTGYRHRYLRFRNQKIQIFPTQLAEKEQILAIEQLFQRFLLRTFKLSILTVSEVLSHAIYQFHIVPQSELMT